MNNALSLGQYVFFGGRKAVVIERDGLYVTVVVFARNGAQSIMSHVPARVFTLTARNVRRKLGQARTEALATHYALPTDRKAVAYALLAFVTTAAMIAGFIVAIMARWAL